MKIVIDIPEDVYTRLFDNGIQDNEIAVDDVCEMARAIRNGVPIEPCEDAISRQAVIAAIDTWDKFGVDDTNSLFRLDNLSLPHYVPYMHYDDVIKCIKGMPPVTPESKMKQFAEWVAEEIFDDNWEYNKDAFAELACRKLAKLGIVRAKGNEWEFVEPQESEDKK